MPRAAKGRQPADAEVYGRAVAAFPPTRTPRGADESCKTRPGTISPRISLARVIVFDDEDTFKAPFNGSLPISDVFAIHPRRNDRGNFKQNRSQPRPASDGVCFEDAGLMGCDRLPAVNCDEKERRLLLRILWLGDTRRCKLDTVIS